uniref:Uncharacterized protein n=1 Tax=Arion vulgaris TaxID=1028688 RepID=A0A0B6ZJD7_9EUPU
MTEKNISTLLDNLAHDDADLSTNMRFILKRDCNRGSYQRLPSYFCPSLTSIYNKLKTWTNLCQILDIVNMDNNLKS